MESKTVIFHFNKTELRTLVQKNGSDFSLSKIHFEDSISLSNRKLSNNSYTILDNEIDFDGHCWISVLEINKFQDNDGAIFCEALGKLWPLLEDHSYPLPSLFIKESFNQSDCTFYGGTFNPWHEGHSECLEKCPNKSIVIIPDSSPWKENLFDQCYFETYMNICKKFKDSSYSVFPGFFGLEIVNPTVDWISKALIKKKSLLMGDDNFVNIFKWKDAVELIKELRSIYVLARDHSLTDFEETKEKVTSYNPLIDIVYLGEHDFMNLSSTKLRKM